MKSLKMISVGLGLAVAAILAGPVSAVDERNTLLPENYRHYVPSIVPERIVLLPTATPENSQTVTWRTDSSLTDTVAEITRAVSHPGLHIDARGVRGDSTMLRTENGTAHHHSVTFTGLTPDTLYAYRVKGSDTWSEWLQFRTPTADFEPYELLYFGDAQNAVKSHFSRTLREAQRQVPNASLMIHAGDMVNSREGVHDDEWGEWFDAGGWLYGMTNQFVVPGNHEYLTIHEDDPRVLMPHWPAQFTVPDNGPQGMTETVFYVDFQGVRYISLDSQAALQDEENARLQAEWLDQVLQDNTALWTIVVHHHPIFSVSLGRDNPIIRDLWQPLYEKHGVDLVFQGHDHTYGRGRAQGSAHGPVYVVSVAGPKMYLVSETAERNMDRTGEDRQLFQVIRFEEQRLSYQSMTATGELYDAFELVRATRLEDKHPAGTEARCGNSSPPRETRCWNGTELIMQAAPAR